MDYCSAASLALALALALARGPVWLWLSASPLGESPRESLLLQLWARTHASSRYQPPACEMY